MCGIAGIWRINPQEVDNAMIKKMTDSIAHRGPDAEGHWTNEKGIILGHRRLSILDLDSRSNQPFHYLGRYVITYNGEIYNYIELRKELKSKGYVFLTDSDTEVICAAFHQWGEKCLSYFDGMFAFALYDSETDLLFCARDRFGEKPFFYSNDERGLFFGSEMKSLWSANVKKKLRDKMIYYFLVHDLVEDVENPELTFYENIKKLKPSHYFIVKNGEEPVQKKYYNLSIESRFEGSFNEAVEHFYFLLKQSVQYRMRADVDLGSSLSGGMDSSSITAIMQQFKEGNSTFSARFNNFDKDESKFIDIVSNNYKTKQYNCFPNEDGFESDFNKLCYHQEEPFQSGSIYAQFQVYKLAKQQNTLVLLDGQGADELLGGYFNYLLPYYFELSSSKSKNEFIEIMKLNQNINLKPTLIEKFQFTNPQLINQFRRLKKIIPFEHSKGITNELKDAYKMNQPFKTFNDLKKSLAYSMNQQGLEKLLRFSDRNAMAHSIEVRLPFLSHHLVDFVFSLPSNYFFYAGWTKSILRNSVQNILPHEIVWRKDKVGFEAPQNQWLKSASLQDKLSTSHQNLINEKFITNDYPMGWKSLILNEFL
ncbi:MAG: asparagine synthase (glutamine-hydrolyzing) [Crocinitomicaceae bacterium]|nr:asparagine synthase (glutamine-hydrolyzing) [Crocinitomicaceae bacterium]